jgi:hypothetical protein
MTLWPIGQYVGTIVPELTQLGSSAAADTLIWLTVLVNNEQKRLCLSDKAGKPAEITAQVLDYIGWNGKEGAEAKFKNGAGIPLKLSHGVYKNEPCENWNIMCPRPVDAAKRQRLAAKYRANDTGVASIPTTKPPAPTPTPPKAGPPASIAHTKDSAWAAWEQSNRTEKDRNEGWLKCVAELGDESKFTSVEWGKLAAAADVPF